jgi:anti-sigma regulatory factor (Ser/Thr protein kinase)
MVEASQVGEARRRALVLASRLGLDEEECGRVALVVTEAASNLVKHASRGELVLRALQRAPVGGIEVLALDRGPGLADLDRCLRDGFSTAASPGTGLGAIVRLSDLFDCFSLVAERERAGSQGSVAHAGTALLARLWAKGGKSKSEGGELEVGVVNLPRPGESTCGDAWAVHQESGRSVVLVADGLGHGPDAAQAAREAVQVFRQHPQLGPAELLPLMHGALRSTRGAAIAIAEVRPDTQEVRYAGVGNVSGSICTAGLSRNMVSHNGTVGHELRKVQEFSYPFPAGALLIMHSDGLATQWRLDQYPGLASRRPSLVAGVLYRDFQRGRDDTTVVVARRVTEGRT